MTVKWAKDDEHVIQGYKKYYARTGWCRWAAIGVYKLDYSDVRAATQRHSKVVARKPVKNF